MNIITINLCFFLVRHQHNADFENRSEKDASLAKKKNRVILLACRRCDTINQLYWHADTNKTRTFHDYSLGFASWLYTLIKHSHLFIKHYMNEFPFFCIFTNRTIGMTWFLVVPIAPLAPMETFLITTNTKSSCVCWTTLLQGRECFAKK